jgi:hypothetical protein
VAEHADIWHSFGDVATMTRKLGILEEHAAEVGRDVSEIELSNELRGRDEKTADELLAVGVRLFTIGLSGPTYNIDTVRRWIAWRDAHSS